MTGLIYGAIVALWACVLIPLWLRRHVDDQAARIEQHRSALGALARVHGSVPSPAQTASRRRRIWLAVLAMVSLVAVTGWVMEFVPLPGVAVSVGLLLAFCLGIVFARRPGQREHAASAPSASAEPAVVASVSALLPRPARGRHAARWSLARAGREAEPADGYRRTA